MKTIPVDANRIQVLVVGEPRARMKEDQAVLDRDTGRPVWNIGVAVIFEGRAETIQLSVPEGGFPKELGIGAFIIAEGVTAFHWENDRGWGVGLRANSVKVVGGSAGLKSVAA